MYRLKLVVLATVFSLTVGTWLKFRKPKEYERIQPSSKCCPKLDTRVLYFAWEYPPRSIPWVLKSL